MTWNRLDVALQGNLPSSSFYTISSQTDPQKSIKKSIKNSSV